MNWLLLYILVMNLVAYITFAIDKRKAKHHDWRIPEKRLFVLALIGGGIGSFRGMRDFHHKTKKWSFRILIPLFALINIGVIVYLRMEWLTAQGNNLLILWAVVVHLVLFYIFRLIARRRRH